MLKLDLNDVINTFCPWSGKPVSADSLTRSGGRIVGFCNPGCRGKIERGRYDFKAAILASGDAADPGQRR